MFFSVTTTAGAAGQLGDKSGVLTMCQGVCSAMLEKDQSAQSVSVR